MPYFVHACVCTRALRSARKGTVKTIARSCPRLGQAGTSVALVQVQTASTPYQPRAGHACAARVGGCAPREELYVWAVCRRDHEGQLSSTVLVSQLWIFFLKKVASFVASKLMITGLRGNTNTGCACRVQYVPCTVRAMMKQNQTSARASETGDVNRK